jgi:hypothetical protein
VAPPPPKEAQLPPNAPPVSEPIEGPKTPPADKPKAAPPPPAQVVQTLPGRALINALRTPRYTTRLSSDQANDPHFSEIEKEFSGGIFRHSSYFTLLETSSGAELPRLERQPTSMTLNVAVAPDAFTFGGTGQIQFNEQASYQLQGPQYSVPAQVPLNTAKLIEWQVPGTKHYVRFNVGGVTGFPEQFRACFDILLPGIDRVACTHHLRSDGSHVGADTIERRGGEEVVHETNDESESPRRIFYCQLVSEGRFSARRETYSYSMFQFKSPFLYQNRALSLKLESGYGGAVQYTQTDVGGGLIEESVSNPRATTTFRRQGNALTTWRQNFGFIDYGYVRTCQ